MSWTLILGLAAAAVANMIIGFIWYNPRVFGKSWMRMSGITPEKVEQGKKRMGVTMVASFIAAMMVAFTLTWIGVNAFVNDASSLMLVAFWVWLGVVAPVLLGTVLWDQKPLKLYAINVGYWLVSFLVMALLIGAIIL